MEAKPSGHPTQADSATGRFRCYRKKDLKRMDLKAVSSQTRRISLQECESNEWRKIGAEIARCRDLEQLVVIRCNCADELNFFIEELAKMKTLRLDGCGLSDEIIGPMQSLNSIEELSLNQNPSLTTLTWAEAQKKLTKLQKFEMLNTAITELEYPYKRLKPENIKRITCNFPELRQLNLDGNNIGAQGAMELAKSLLKLEQLSLIDNSIGFEGAAAICRSLPKLSSLHINSNKLGNDGAQLIARWLPNLSCLWIDSNNVDEEGAYQLTRGIGKVLDLSISSELNDNRIGSGGTMMITRTVTSLESLSIYNCNILKSLTHHVGLFAPNLKKLLADRSKEHYINTVELTKMQPKLTVRLL